MFSGWLPSGPQGKKRVGPKGTQRGERDCSGGVLFNLNAANASLECRDGRIAGNDDGPRPHRLALSCPARVDNTSGQGSYRAGWPYKRAYFPLGETAMYICRSRSRLSDNVCINSRVPSRGDGHTTHTHENSDSMCCCGAWYLGGGDEGAWETEEAHLRRNATRGPAGNKRSKCNNGVNS